MVNLEQCKKAELYQGEQLLCEAGVTAGPTGGVLLTVPRSVRAGGDAYYTVKFYDAALGVLTCRCVLSSPMELPEDMVSLRCDIRETLEQLQRRLDVKVPTSVPVMLHAERRPGDLYIPLKGWPATVKNISAGGVFLVSTMVAMTGDQLTFTFPLTETPISLTAEILRVELRVGQTSRSTYGYGCRFVDLGVFQESQLRSYVYQEERRLYRPE